jgi:glycosyltransferase involved in cell wall biosynthesis
MRILHVLVTLDPAWGGPPRVVTRLAAAQAAIGHEVCIVSFGNDQTPGAVAEMTATIPQIDRVTLEYWPWPNRVESVLAREARRKFMSMLADFDVLHAHGVWEPLLRAATSAAQHHRKPYFIQPNGMLDVWCMQQKRLKKKLALAMGYRSMLNSAAGIFCGNDDERIAIEPLGLSSPPIVIPLNAVFTEEIAALPQRGSFSKRYPQLCGKPFVVFLGRLHIKKGLDFLADAFALFARGNATHHLVVIGHDEGAKADFEQRIAKAGVQDRVLLTGPLHGAAKWEAFADAAAFTLPSRQEGFSIAITEALACGLPVIISKDCHFPEVAQAGAGEVVELNAEAVAKAFANVVNDDAVRQRMASAARNLVATRFNCHTMAREVVSAYERALKSV